MHPSLCGSGGKAEAASAKVLRQCERLSQSRAKPELPVLARLGWCHADDSAWFGWWLAGIVIRFTSKREQYSILFLQHFVFKGSPYWFLYLWLKAFSSIKSQIVNIFNICQSQSLCHKLLNSAFVAWKQPEIVQKWMGVSLPIKLYKEPVVKWVFPVGHSLPISLFIFTVFH